MHANSMKLMAQFVAKYVKPGMTVLDIGSYDVNGNYKGLFSRMEYLGADIEAGPNVDVIVNDGYFLDSIGKKTFDTVISGQTLEHVFEPWKTCELIGRHCHDKAI